MQKCGFVNTEIAFVTLRKGQTITPKNRLFLLRVTQVSCQRCDIVVSGTIRRE